jgi:uncharacterized protein YegL
MEGLKIDSCNTALREIQQAIASDPIVNDKVRICVISFSDSAEVLLPLSKMTDVVDFPGLVVKGGTNYGSAFTCLKQTIQDDIAASKAQNDVKVNRPIVFFISDGEPTDTNWQAAHAAVVDKNWSFSPHIIAFGVGGAQAETIKKVATKSRHGNQFAFLADDNANPGAVFKEVFKSFLSTIAGSAPNLNPNGLNAPRDVFYLVPVYLVLEESSALSENSISAINQAIPEIHRAISIDPLINESVRVSIVSFSDSTEVLMPLSNLNEVTEFPGLVAKGNVNFRELFLKIQEVLIYDFSRLSQSVKHYARPFVFILAASNPSDESWREQRERLINDPRFHNPHIVVLGVGEAKASIMVDIATKAPLNHHSMAYRLTETTQLGELIRESIDHLYFGSFYPIND